MAVAYFFYFWYQKRSLYTYFLSVPQRKLLQTEEETEEEKQFRAIYQQIAGEVSTQRGGEERLKEMRRMRRAKCECLSVTFELICNKLSLPPSGHADLCQRTQDGHEEHPRQT